MPAKKKESIQQIKTDELWPFKNHPFKVVDDEAMLLVFVIGCSIYCIMTANWKSLMILAVIGGAVVILFMLIGLLLGVIDIGVNGAKRRLNN